MLLSRFWMVLLSLALGAAAFTLFVGGQMYNRAGSRAMREALAADSSAVSWFLKDDSRQRASALIRIALSPENPRRPGQGLGEPGQALARRQG